MGIPRVIVNSKYVLTQGGATNISSGYEAAIVIDSKKGRTSPLRVNSISEFLSEYTTDNVIPAGQTTNRSAYYSAISFLSSSGSGLWVKRAVPSDALSAVGYFFEYTDPIEIDMTDAITDGNFETSDDGDIEGLVNGMRATIYGSVPSTLLGKSCYVKIEEDGSDFIVSLWEDEAMTEDKLPLTGSTIAYLVVSEYSPSVGLTSPATNTPDTGYSLYSCNPGSWGNGVYVSVEVPREREDGLSADQRLLVDTSEIPVSATWARPSSVLVPVSVFKGSSSSVLPAGLTESSGEYFVTGANASGSKVSVLAKLNNAVDDVETAGFTTTGSGSMVIAPVGDKAVVSLKPGSSTILNVDSGGNADGTLKNGSRCFVSGNLPENLSNGVLYYLSENSGDITISLTSGGSAINVSDAVSFTISCLLYQDSAIDVDPQSAGTLAVTQYFPDGTPVTLGTENTVYYVKKKSDDDFKLEFYSSLSALLSGGSKASVTASTSKALKPVNVYDNWTVLYDTIPLDGDVDYINNTIRLNSHTSLGGFQGWVPGELIRFSANTGSTLPQGLTQYSRYRIVPVDDNGTVKIGRIIGNVLDNVESISYVSFSELSKGSGTFNLFTGNASLYADTFRVKVYKRNVSGSIVTFSLEEEYVCSLYKSVLDDAGRSLYIEDRLSSSKYINAVAADVEDVPRGTLQIKAVPVLFNLSGGSDGSVLTSTDMSNALQALSDPLQYSYNYLLDGGFSGGNFYNYQSDLLALAETRKCFAILSTPESVELLDDPSTAIREYAETLPSTSFGALHGPWQLITDSTSGSREVVAPPDGFVAAKHAQIDRNRGVGIPVAGAETGGIATKGGRISFSRDQLDDLYDARVNPIIQVSGIGGTVIWGNNTLLNAPTPVSEIHAQKLDNEVVSTLSSSLNRYVMSLINEATYQAIRNTCNAFMGSLVTRGVLNTVDGDGVPYIVICDSSNNTSVDRDAQTINVEVAYKPIRSSKFIKVFPTITPAGVSFESINI